MRSTFSASVRQSCYKEDVNVLQLQKQLPLLVDVIKHGTPLDKKVITIRTVCEAMNAQSVYKTEVHKLLQLYLTIPISLSTAERTFSALKHVLTYLQRSSMSQKRLNNCVLAHVHKNMLDGLDIVDIAREFIMVNGEQIKYFGLLDS